MIQIKILEENQPIERFALLYTNAPEEAEAFRSIISDLVPKGDYYSVDITPVIRANLGPGDVEFELISGKSEFKKDNSEIERKKE